MKKLNKSIMTLNCKDSKKIGPGGNPISCSYSVEVEGEGVKTIYAKSWDLIWEGHWEQCGEDTANVECIPPAGEPPTCELSLSPTRFQRLSGCMDWPPPVSDITMRIFLLVIGLLPRDSGWFRFGVAKMTWGAFTRKG